jgi:threonine/homoserine/homoserine lactone efflux protein
MAACGNGAAWIAERLERRYSAWIDRVAGAGFVATAALLGLRDIERHQSTGQ